MTVARRAVNVLTRTGLKLSCRLREFFCSSGLRFNETAEPVIDVIPRYPVGRKPPKSRLSERQNGEDAAERGANARHAKPRLLSDGT